MNKLNLQVTPDESKLEELLRKIQLAPSEQFHQKMKQATWRTEYFGPQTTSVGKPRLRLLLAMTVLLLLAGLLITPQGRAWAQEVFQFFTRVNSSTVELPESYLKLMQNPDGSYRLPLVPVIVPTVSPEMAALPGCDTSKKSQVYDCQVALAESQLGFDLKELPTTPEGWNFDFVRFDAVSKSATIGYSLDVHQPSYGTFYLRQGKGEFTKVYPNDPWTLVPADKVEKVKIGDYDGEYVRGSFSLPVNSDKLVWSDADRHARLAWSDGTNWYLIELWPNLNLPDPLDREELIELAEDLVYSPIEQTETPDPDFLYSVSDAEQVSGFDLKAPTLLPMGTSFSYARYYPYNNEVRLFYGLNNELVIYQWKERVLDLETPLHQEPVNVHGGNAIFGSVEGSDPYLYLWWETGGHYYQMYHYPMMGDTLDREKMIAIAESMQDFDDFRRKDYPYEYVPIYARALGFEPREFPGTPRGWSYASVWAAPSMRCILLVYTSTTEQGTLYVSQCLTDKLSDISDVPANAIEQVKVRGKPGQYIVGEFITGDNGETVWDPASPAKQLYWQEEHLWMKLVILGNSTAVYDRDELIEIAESLR
jgi:hypothetical protein